MAYPNINVQTSSGIVALAPNDREQAWAKKIILGAYNLNVFADNMIGTPGSGKAFTDYTDTRRINGNTITLTSVYQLGSEGAQGETTRSGTEEKISPQDQYLTVGRQWYGMGVTTIAQAETIVGSEWDRLNSPLIEQRVGLKKSNDMQMVLRESSIAANRLYPNGKSTVAALQTSDTFQTSVITSANNLLSSNGANPMLIAKDPKRGIVEGFTFMGAQDSITALYQDTAYLQAVENGGVRGSENPMFSGRYADWNGSYIYPIQLRARGTKGSVGSPLRRIAFLGIALPTNSGDATQLAGVITGGGATTQTGFNYFEHFSGYAYKMTNGLSPTAVTGTTSNNPVQTGSILTGDGTGPWYVAIIDTATGKYSMHSYTANTGTTLTGVQRLGTSATSAIVTTLSGSSITYSALAYSATATPFVTTAGGGAQGLNVGTAAIGSLIVEVNAKGVPFADSLGLGEMAGVCGYGQVPGGSVFGKRTQYIQDNEKDISIGYEFSFGCRAWLNPDNVPTNYVRITHAIAVPGLPNSQI